ncbi:triple tyrosine motif-containing protein [Candidatus Poribacteria bacterium]
MKGFYITDSENLIVDRYGTVIDASYPTAMDDSPAVKGNLIPNSSFEAGFGHGWGFVTGDRDYSISSLWDKTQGYHGKASVKLPPWGKLVSRVIHVQSNRKYTLSLWAKPVTAPASLILSIYSVHEHLKGLKPMTKLEKTFELTNGWEQLNISGYLKDYPTNEYQIRINTRDNGAWIDALQLEEGELSTYQAREPLEIGLVCDKSSNIFFEDESIAMQLLAHNSTDQTITGKIRYEIYDFLNRQAKTGTVDADVPANTTWQTDLDVSTGNRGAFRIVIWVAEKNATEEEVVYSIVPRPRVTGPDQDSMIGIHANASDCQYEALKRLGVKWQRILSPSAWFRWHAIEPAKGEFIWHDAAVQKTISHGFWILGTIGTNEWPKWADRDGKPDLDEWENSVYRIVDHYKEWVKLWEVWNEPIHRFDPPFYAQMLERAARAIHKADSQAKIVGMGGSYKCSWCTEVIQHLDDKPFEYMDYLSTHLYPQKSDPLNPLSGRNAKEFRDKIIVPYKLGVWNTETGAWCLGFHKGPNSSFRSPGEAIWPHQDGLRYYRGSNYQAARVAYNFLHSIGNGFSRYFYYDSRFHAAPDYYKTHCSILDYDDTIRTKGVAYAILAYLFDHSEGLGNISSDAKTYAYLFDRGGTPLVGLFAADAHNKTMTIKLDPSQFKAYDMMGNALNLASSTIPFGRHPVYLEGQEGLSVANVRSAIQNGTISDEDDTEPPNTSISDAPRGRIDGTSVRIRWIAIDDVSVPDNTCPDAILYSYRLLGRDSDWSEWTPKTFVDYADLGPGNFQFEVKAKDEAGNISDTAIRVLRSW